MNNKTKLETFRQNWKNKIEVNNEAVSQVPSSSSTRVFLNQLGVILHLLK